MKSTCCIIVLGLSLIGVQADTAPSNKVSRFIYERCKHYSLDAVTYDNLKAHLDDFLSYLQYTSNLLPNGKKQFCEDEKGRLLRYMEIVAGDMRHCFHRDEKYLPKFLSESFKEFLNFLCEKGGRNIDNFFSSQGTDCLASLEKGQASDQISNCFNKIFAPLNGVLKKQELCDDLDTARKCFTVAIKTYCPNFLSYEALNNKFFDSIRQPCNLASRFSTVSLLIVFLAYLTTRIFS